MESKFTDRIRTMAQVVEKFVEHNLVEKEQRDENLKKLSLAFETFMKESPLRSGFAKAGASADVGDKTPEMTGIKQIPVQIKKLENFKGDLPKYQTPLASGLDVRAQLDEEIVLKPGQRMLVPTGLSFAIPAGFEIQARPRSGLAIRDGISLVNTPGTIDADYRGEVKIILINLSEKDFSIKDQDRIAQLVLCPVVQAQFEEVTALDETDRGQGGFGSTGKN